MALALLFACGCIAQHGIQFGNWAERSDPIPLTQTHGVDAARAPSDQSVILVLPPLGHLPDNCCSVFHSSLAGEVRRCFGTRVVDVEPDGSLKEYVNRENLVPTEGVFDFQEAARVGRLLSATHVLCTWVRDARVHPPQVLNLYFALVDVASGQAVEEMDAAFDASEQEVVIAARDHLQSRVARHYDTTNLDCLLRSPAEFQSFAAAVCARDLAAALKKQGS